jgi:AraC-like DNA-binding protein
MFRKLKSADWFHADGFPIAVEWRNPQSPFPPHYHDFSEVVIVTGGKGLHVTGRQSWILSAGDVFVIGGSRSHAYRDVDGLRLVNVLFRPELLRLEVGDLAQLPGYHALFTLEPAWRKRHQFESRLRLSPGEQVSALGLVEHLDQELRGREPGFGFLAKALFMQLVGQLSRCYGRLRNSDSRDLLRIAEAITHLETRFGQPVSLADLAAIAHMSKRNFLRAFQSAIGLTPIAYLIQLRVNRAATLLRSTSESVTEIAFRCGFADSNYFTRQFRKIMDRSPRQYRHQEGFNSPCKHHCSRPGHSPPASILCNQTCRLEIHGR